MHFLRRITAANQSDIATNFLYDVNLTYTNVFQWTRNALECRRCTIPCCV